MLYLTGCVFSPYDTHYFHGLVFTLLALLNPNKAGLFEVAFPGGGRGGVNLTPPPLHI